MADLVRTARHGEILEISLNRPEKRNALSLELINALGNAIEGAAASDARVVVLAGEGPAFCAGMDLKGVIDDPETMGRTLHRLAEVILAIRRLLVPTIARVQGAAIGGGCGLMIVVDLAITHAEAKLGYPEVDLGVCPAVVAPWLQKKIGDGPARAMLLRGGTIDGTEGLRRGLVDELVERDRLHEHVAELATSLAKGGRQAIAATKTWLNRLEGSENDAVVERGATISAEVIRGEEAQERLRAMFAGR